MKGNARTSVVLRTLILLLLAALPVVRVAAQAPPANDWQFTFAGKVTEFDEKKQKDVPLDGCVITLLKSGQEISSVGTSGGGKFKFKLDPNGDYTVKVTKAGYITKLFSISTSGVPPERGEAPFAEFDVEIDLFKIFPGLDYSVLNQPIAKIVYNPSKDVDDFDYDKVYAAQMQAALDRLKQLAAEARAKQKAYQAAIDAADKYFAGKDWNNAKAQYQAALAILPNEQYPKDQIAKCDANLASDAAANASKAQYDNLIKDADAKFAGKDWANAKSVYQQASALQPTQQYPKDQITKCDANIAAAAAAAAKDKQYNDLITQADAKFGTKDWAGAKAIYQSASALKTDQQYPKDQITKCDANIAADASAAAKDKQYNDLIKDADAKFAAKDWANAKTVYTQASGVKPDQQYPKDQIAKCDANISADAAAVAKDKQYNDLIKDADAKFAAKDWSNAKSVYTQASGIKPDQQYPKDQIAKCDANISADAAAAAKDKQYSDLIAQADTKFGAKDWAGAKTIYTQASALKADQQYPKDQIAKCDANIAAAADAAAKDKQYNDLVKQADAKFTAKDWANAKTIYTQASGVKPDQQYPKDQIVKCDANIAAAADAAAKDKQYNDLIKDADAKFAAKNWADAKTVYQSASAVKPDVQYPKDQIAKCDANISADAANAAKDKQYNDLIAQADTKFGAKDWSGAKDLYQQAIAVKSTQYAKDQVAKCDANIAADANAAAKEKQYNDLIAQADTKFGAKDWAGAKTIYKQASALKPDQQYPKDQIAKCDANIASDAAAATAAAKDKQYSDLIAQADTKFGAKDWNSAKSIYTQASAIKPDQQYPKDQIAKCDANIAADAASAKDKQYNDLIAQADTKFGAKDWKGAKAIYQQASVLKADQQYPKDQIAKCDANSAADADAAAKAKQYDAFVKDGDTKFAAKNWSGAKAAYQNAAGIKPDEQYPKDQIAKCDANIANEMDAAAKNKQYNDLIKDADAKFAAKNWADAKSVYQQASALKDDQQYPKDQIAKCDANISADAANAAKDKQYNDLIAQADTKFGAKDWSGAKDFYQQALALKATQYAKDQIAKCDANIAADSNAAAKEEKYNNLIKDADAKFSERDWKGAKTTYQQASLLKPDQQYPKDQIAKCDANIAADAANANAAAKDKQYNDLIVQADGKFGTKDWKGAKTIYQQASALKTDQQYPKDQIAKCDANIAADAATADAAAKDKQYNDLIKQADGKFGLKDWAGAKTIYQQASALKADQQYPKDQITKCDANISAAMDAAARDKQYNDLIKDADAKFAAKNYADAKAKYTDALALKADQQYPKDQIAKCDDAMNAALSLDQKYNSAVKRGDSAMTANDLENAKEAFTIASQLKPNEAYPKQKLKEIADLMAANQKDRAYHALLAKGDSLMNAKNYVDAKKTFQAAVAQKPTDDYPQNKISEIDRILADQKFVQQQDSKYNALIAKADAKFKAKDWKSAKDLYGQALNVKAGEKYPVTQIAECNKQLNPAVVQNTTNDPQQTKDQYVSDLVKKYGQGKTKMDSQDGGTSTTTVIVVVGNKGWQYTKKVYSWGGVFYFKDGEQISESTFNYETSDQYVKSLQDADGSGSH